jgi:hypothetical protein
VAAFHACGPVGQRFSIDHFGPADPDSPVRLRIAGLRVLSARLVTQQGDTIHCRFDTPLHEAVVAHIGRAAPGKGASSWPARSRDRARAVPSRNDASGATEWGCAGRIACGRLCSGAV